MEQVTVNEITKFFIKTLKSYANNQIQNRKEKIISTKIPITIDKSYVKKSKIHGNGLFAKVNINAGDIITFYPCDVLKSKNDHKVANKYKCYTYTINDSYSIVGFPENNKNPTYLGHICNDGARGRCQKDRDIYNKITLIKSNAMYNVICDSIVAVIAIKDINIGDEILVSYTHNYWINQI
jgi:SET domain-containing protein